MSFTRAQQGKFRPLVKAGWARACRLDATLLHAADKAAAQRAWYEAELEAATGQTTTIDCDRKRDFEDAMEHFEMIVGESIYWATRKYGSDARRILYNIRESVRDADVDEDYMRGVARRALRLRESDPLPELATLSYPQLRTIMGELKRFLSRGGRPRVHQEMPF